MPADELVALSVRPVVPMVFPSVPVAFAPLSGRRIAEARGELLDGASEIEDLGVRIDLHPEPQI
jgi:hypothetical protein